MFGKGLDHMKQFAANDVKNLLSSVLHRLTGAMESFVECVSY